MNTFRGCGDTSYTQKLNQKCYADADADADVDADADARVSRIAPLFFE